MNKKLMEKKAKEEFHKKFVKDYEESELRKTRSQEININIPDQKTILDRFSEQISSKEPIRDLFTGSNIKYKTQLTEEQRGALSVLFHSYKLCEKYGIKFDGLKYVLDEYIDFGVSIDRKSRDEFVKSQQAQQQVMQQQKEMAQANQLRM